MLSPQICICMATHNPPEMLFRRQVASIRAQSHDNWRCLVQDDASRADKFAMIERVLAGDPRFLPARNSRTLGFYLNFERCLTRVPAECPLVCLADQDDAWYPQKLSTLAAALREPRVQLVFADMRIVDEHLLPIPEATGAARRSGPPEFESLFFTNTVTGAASMFRASLLPAILPFPAPRGRAFHDWWIALVALAAGGIRYIDEPLHDYCQHASNAVGWRRVGRGVSWSRLLYSGPYREELRQAARNLRHEDFSYLSEAIETLDARVPVSCHAAAIRRLRSLRQAPLRTMARQYLRALLAGKGTRRKRHLLLAHAFGSQTPSA